MWNKNSYTYLSGCPLCGSTNLDKAIKRADELFIYKCNDCFLAFINPRPSTEELMNYYDSNYFSGKKDFFASKDYCDLRNEAILAGTVTGYQEIIQNIRLKGMTVLDIGCATGALLVSLKSHGPRNLVGIDLSCYAVEYGRQRYGLDLRTGPLESFNFPEASFDVVLMIDTIEHVINLREFTQHLGRILKPGGDTFLITPNFESILWAKKRWISLSKDFEHVQYFSHQSLNSFCRINGFHLTKSWTRGIPIALKSYPEITPHGFHRIKHLNVAAGNLFSKLSFNLGNFRKKCGMDLCGILKRDGAVE